MDKTKKNVYFLCKYILILIVIFASNINFVFYDNILASELPTIELNTKAEENVEEKQDTENDNVSNKDESFYLIIDYSKYYIVLIIALAIAIISIVINVSFMLKKKKEKEYKKQVDKIKSKYIYDKDVKVNDNKISNEKYIKNDDKHSLTSMTGKIVIQLYDKTNNIVYDTSFESSKENTEIKLGRGDRANVDIKIPLPNVSDRHCIILKRGYKYFLKDLDSTNGTKYNGVKVVDKIELNYQGNLSLGRSEFELKILDSKYELGVDLGANRKNNFKECKKGHHIYFVKQEHTGATEYVCSKCGKVWWCDLLIVEECFEDEHEYEIIGQNGIYNLYKCVKCGNEKELSL